MTTEMPSTIDNGFSEEAYFAHLAKIPEYPWLKKIKETAWESYQQLPYPTRTDEPYRFASVKRVSDFGFCTDAEANTVSLVQRSNLVAEPAGRIVLVNDHTVESTLDPALAEQGVIFMPLAQALEEHVDLIEKHFSENLQTLGADKFLALHLSMFHNGTFLYVPKNVVIKQPLLAYHWVAGQDMTIFPHTLIIAEEGAEASVLDYFGNADSQQAGLVSSAGLVIAHSNAKIFRKYVQNMNEHSTISHVENTLAERDAQPITININLGSHYARHESVLRITGENANVRLYGLTVGAGKQEFDQRTLQVHAAPHAFSDLLYKNALLEKTRTIFSGMIKVEEDAQQTDAYQTNRNLQLSDDAEANSLPGLEILANDVKCSHGATTGRLDESELFYMRSRGIKPTEAKRLLVFGFFEEVLEKIKHEELAESLRELVHDKFDAIRSRES